MIRRHLCRFCLNTAPQTNSILSFQRIKHTFDITDWCSAITLVAALVAPLIALAELICNSYRRSNGCSWLRLCLAELKTAMRSRESPETVIGQAAAVAASPCLRPLSPDKADLPAGEDSVRERLLYRKVEEDRFENSRL